MSMVRYKNAEHTAIPESTKYTNCSNYNYISGDVVYSCSQVARQNIKYFIILYNYDNCHKLLFLGIFDKIANTLNSKKNKNEQQINLNNVNILFLTEFHYLALFY